MTRKDFIKAVENIRVEYNQNPDSWENKTMNEFLETMVRYSENIQGRYDNPGQKIDAK